MKDHEFIIAIKKNDPEYWLSLAERFPMEDETLGDFFLFTIRAEDLGAAVRVAKIRRAALLAKSAHEPTNETLE